MKSLLHPEKAAERAARHIPWEEAEGSGFVWFGEGWGETSLLSSSFWRGWRRGGVMSSSPWIQVTGCTGRAQAASRRSERTLGRCISLLRGWSKTWTGFLERWSISPWTCHCLRGIWTMPFTTCFKFWWALNSPGCWTRWLLQTSSNWAILLCSVLLISVLLYPLLFYSSHATCVGFDTCNLRGASMELYA